MYIVKMSFLKERAFLVIFMKRNVHWKASGSPFLQGAILILMFGDVKRMGQYWCSITLTPTSTL